MSWPLISLKELCLFQKKSKRKAGEGLKNGEYPFYTSSQVLSKRTNEPDYDLSPSLIFGTGGQPSIHITSSKFSLSGDCIATTPIDSSKVCAKFIFFYLSGNIHILEEGFKGAGLKHISKAYLENILIPLPPITIQNNIVAVLEKADQLRKDCKLLEQELNSLAQSVFIDIFGDPVTNPKGWDKRTLLELVENKDDIKCGPFGTQLGKSEFTTVGVPLWGIKHVNSGFKKTTVEFVSDEKALDLQAYSIVAGDIVMTRKGNVGNCYIYPESLQNGIMHSDLLRIRACNTKICTSFLQKQFMYSRDVEGQLRLISQGAIMAGINVTKLKSLVLLSPPLEVQKKYEQILNEIEIQKSMLVQNLNESTELFNSLTQKAFKGELNL